VDLILEALADGMIEGWQNFPARYRLPVLLGQIIKYILVIKKQRVSERKIRLALKGLERRKILNIKKKDDKVYIYVQEKGKMRVVKYSLKLLLDYKQKKKCFDGRWFLVFFDVPEAQRIKRDSLRKFLKGLGFYQYQQSVYIFPYECREEVRLIKKIVEGAKYMKYIIAEEIEEEAMIKSFFHLS